MSHTDFLSTKFNAFFTASVEEGWQTFIMINFCGFDRVTEPVRNTSSAMQWTLSQPERAA
jgi:hypothetical protein